MLKMFCLKIFSSISKLFIEIYVLNIKLGTSSLAQLWNNISHKWLIGISFANKIISLINIQLITINKIMIKNLFYRRHCYI